jgi:tRNA (guanine37-N1)-methyltransferase
MRVDVVTIFPEMVQTASGHGVTGRAVERGLISLAVWNPRDYATDRHRTVDDRPYGGGPGMVMKPEPLTAAIRAAKAAGPADRPVVYLSPQGRVLDQAEAARLAALPGMVLVAGRYEGVDERVIEAETDLELSIGDYVLSGGELAALVVLDAVARLVPGVLGDADSAVEDSFVAGLLDHPHFTRPEEFAGRRVPEVLQSGDHAAVRRWRLKQALGRTWLKRPDLIAARRLNAEERELLDEFVREHEGRRTG